MTDTPTTDSRDFVTRTLLYQEFLAEGQEILRYKWIESEKAGQDIGFEKALLGWIVRHRSAWHAHRQRDEPCAS